MKEGRPHGKGRVVLPNGTTIDGVWEEGELIRGKQINMEAAGGMLYEGEYKNGLFHGQGKGCSADQLYVGEWFEGVPHGRGRFVSTSEGHTYEGDVRHGQPHGQGRETNEKASTNYEGHFKEGMKHGAGVMQGPHHRYEGEWRNDRMEGRGKLRWKTSRKPDSGEEEYEGEWRAGLQHGTGTSTVFDRRGRKTSIYEGKWQDGHKHGQGRELSPQGVVLRTGTWTRGVFTSPAAETKPAPSNETDTAAMAKTPRRRGRPPKAKQPVP